MSKQEMARKSVAILCKLFYEDVEFVYKFIEKIARKRGVAV